MKVLSAKFVKSIVDISHIPQPPHPEIAFAGRSNVGKSSLINTLLNRKKLALTSSSPGKTRLINFFNVNDNLYLVDLPGYGFARVSKKERLSWKKMIESYITGSAQLKGIIHLIDCKVGPTPLDLEMIEWMHLLQKPVLVVATKADKISKSKVRLFLKAYAEKMGVVDSSQIVPFSAVTKQGKREIWQAIDQLLRQGTP